MTMKPGQHRGEIPTQPLALPAEDDLLKYQSVIAESEEQLQKYNQDVAELLIKYSKDYFHGFAVQLQEKQASEHKLQKDLKNSYDQLYLNKKEWRKRVMQRLKDQYLTMKQKRGPFAESLLQNSKVLKQVDEHPALQLKSEEGFGAFELGVNEIIIYPDKKLGSGAFGEVYKGLCRGKEVAVKTMKQTKFNPNIVEEFFTECAVMRSIPHKNILLFMGACTVPGRYKLVTEIAVNGSLDSLLHPHSDVETTNKLHFSRKVKIAREIAEGMNWLHSRSPPLLHLDLKPANILLVEDYAVKIADFGISRLQRSIEKKDDKDSDTATTGAGIGGTPLYMPPEMFDRAPIPTKKCDVYAYGMILWEMASEDLPYKGKYDTLLKLSLAVTNNERPTIPDNISTTLSHLIMDCWDGNPDRRPLFSDILDEKEDYFNKMAADWIANGQHRINNLWQQFEKNSVNMVEDVPWPNFKDAFCQLMNVNPNDQKYARAIQGVHELLEVGGDNGKVTVDKFKRFIRWFSPIQPVGSGNSTFDDVVTLLSQNWFWGPMSAKQAVDKLDVASVPSGSFLVRFSDNQEGQFVISMKTRQNKKDPPVVNHHRITQQPNTNIPIVTLVNQKIKHFHLKKSLNGRPAQYVTLFVKNEAPSLYVLGAPTDGSSLSNTPWHGTNVIY